MFSIWNKITLKHWYTGSLVEFEPLFTNWLTPASHQKWSNESTFNPTFPSKHLAINIIRILLLWLPAQNSRSHCRELDSGGTDKLWLRAYTGHVEECPASVFRSQAEETCRGQTAAFQWWLKLWRSLFSTCWSLSAINQGDPASTVLQLILVNKTLWKHVQVLFVDSVSRDRQIG